MVFANFSKIAMLTKNFLFTTTQQHYFRFLFPFPLPSSFLCFWVHERPPFGAICCALTGGLPWTRKLHIDWGPDGPRKGFVLSVFARFLVVLELVK